MDNIKEEIEQAIKSGKLTEVLNGKNVADLRKLAKEYKLQGYSSMTKQPLIQAITAQVAAEYSLDANKNESDILLQKYAAAAAHLYGVISLDDFVVLFNSQNENQINTEETVSALTKHKSADSEYVLWDKYITNYYFESYGFKNIDACIKSASKRKRYVPDKEQLLKYADKGYFEETYHTRKVREFINAYLSDDSALTNEIIEKIIYASFSDTKFQSLIDIFSKYKIEFKSKQQLERFVPFLLGLYNNSRRWSNAGSTPAEINELYSLNQTQGANNKNVPLTYSIQKGAPLNKAKVGRNEPCPCGSGKKYKKCCLTKLT